MDEVQRHNGSFVVRIWWEQSGTDADSPPFWRGWAQHVRNGRQIYFQNFQTLLDFMEQETGSRVDIQWQPPSGLV